MNKKSPMNEKTVVLSINASWNIFNFRLNLVRALQQRGFRVVALAPPDDYSARLQELGITYVPIPMDKKGVSPSRDLLLLARYHRTLKRLKPDIFLGYTAKPNVYGSLAAQGLGIPVINNVSGLGTAFIKQGLLTRIVSGLYKLAFKRSSCVFFQNNEDRDMFLELGLVRPKAAKLLPGSGVDLERFNPGGADSESMGALKFIMIARLLWDKGVGEFVEAARIVRQQEPDVRFQMLGFVDVANRTAVTRSQVDAWVEEGLIEYLGTSDDVRPFIQDSDCVVLPSYREGLPRTLLEAGAMAKPLITTDVPGCRQVVDDGVNGFLCKVRDPQSLADAMLKMIRSAPEERKRLGAAGRRKIETQYDERIAIGRYLDEIAAVLATP